MLAGDHLGSQAQHVGVELAVCVEGGERAHVAEVRGEEGLAAAGQAECALQRRRGPAAVGRRAAAAPPVRARTPAGGVWETRGGRPSPRSGGGSGGRDRGTRPHVPQARAGLLVVHGDRLVGAVAAGHHQRRPDVRGEQVVQRRVGKHHTEDAVAGRDRLRHRAAGHAPGEHDRPRRRAEQRPLALVELLGTFGHHGERLLLALLARAPGDRACVRRVAVEVPAAEPLHRHDRALQQ